MKKDELPKEFRKILQLLLVAIIITVVFHVFWQLVAWVAHTDNRVLNDIVNRFNLDKELSFPTWVNSMLAFIAGCLAWIVAKNKHGRRKRYTWYVVALVFIGISIDEVAALHELLLQGLHILANFGEGQGLLNNAWLIMLPLIIIGVIFCIRELHKNLPKNTSQQLVTALFVYLFGALVVEFLSIPFDKSLLIYNIGMVVVEETLEMFGIWLAIRAIMVHISNHESELKQRIIDIIS